MKRPSKAGSCAESCLKWDKLNPAVFSCKRAFSIKKKESISFRSKECDWDNLYQFLVIERRSWKDWRQSSISLGGGHRLKNKRQTYRLAMAKLVETLVDLVVIYHALHWVVWLIRVAYSTLRTYWDGPRWECVNGTINKLVQSFKSIREKLQPRSISKVNHSKLLH